MNNAEPLRLWFQAFVKCKNYYGIQFVKGLHIFKNKLQQKAEVCYVFIMSWRSYIRISKKNIWNCVLQWEILEVE